MRAIGYMRVSTKGQADDDKYGIEVQRKAIEEYASANGYEVIEWIEDEGSGASDDREGLRKIMNETYNPPIEAVIVFKNDRIARDTKMYFYYLYSLEKRNVKLISTKEEFAEGSEFANIYRALLQFVAEQERRNIALRTGRGRESKATYGGYSGGRAPYGYKAESGRLVVVEEERELIEYIFAEHDKGVPMLTIADNLRDMGKKTRKGTHFQAATIKSILSNRPLYEGKYKYGNMEWVQGVHEAILKGE